MCKKWHVTAVLQSVTNYGSAESEEEHSQAAQYKKPGVPLMRDDSAFESEYTKVSNNPCKVAAKSAPVRHHYCKAPSEYLLLLQ